MDAKTRSLVTIVSSAACGSWCSLCRLAVHECDGRLGKLTGSLFISRAVTDLRQCTKYRVLRTLRVICIPCTISKICHWSCWLSLDHSPRRVDVPSMMMCRETDGDYDLETICRSVHDGPMGKSLAISLDDEFFVLKGLLPESLPLGMMKQRRVFELSVPMPPRQGVVYIAYCVLCDCGPGGTGRKRKRGGDVADWPGRPTRLKPPRSSSPSETRCFQDVVGESPTMSRLT